MIPNYEKWKMTENFGSGDEVFTEKLDMYGSMRNLDIHGFNEKWGDIQDASGTFTYKVTMEMGKSGIESIVFDIESIDLEIETIVFVNDDDQEGEEKTTHLEITKEQINDDNVEYEVNQFPLYLTNLELDFSGVDDINDKNEFKKMDFSFTMGDKNN